MSGAIQAVDRSQIPNLVRLAEPFMDEFDLQKLGVMLTISQSVFVGLVDGQYACCWGLVPPSALSDKAYLWLQTTPLVEERKFLLVRQSQRWMEWALTEYSEIIGFCKPDNALAIRWIKWLGGEFKEPAFGRADFVIRRKNG